VLSGKASLNSSLPDVLGKVDARDRGLTQELAFGTARWQPRLSGLAERCCKNRSKRRTAMSRRLLLVGLYQLFYTRDAAHAAIGETVGCADKLKKPWAKGLLNAVLRNAQRDGEALFAELERDPVIRFAHPRWLQKSLKAHWPEHWEAICAANNAHPADDPAGQPSPPRAAMHTCNYRTPASNAFPCSHSTDGIRAGSRRDVTQPAGLCRRPDQRAGRSGAAGCRSARSGPRPARTGRLLRARRQDLPHP
jgi:16S rRNA (cytosine967-C5)-methyltransferase